MNSFEFDQMNNNMKFDFTKEPAEHKKKVFQNKVIISFLMCVYNDMSMFNRAVNSLIEQKFEDWELIILDNSNINKNAWKIIQNAVKTDNRIRAIKAEKNVGWAKGASICLKEARGEYMSFLAADDCIHVDSLNHINDVIRKDYPDVIWVGNTFVNYDIVHKHTKVSYEVCPEYKFYTQENRSKAICEIIFGVYYNSFFHYCKIEFLKKHEIDFYEPYYGDCAGMTAALELADTMVVLNAAVYMLTINTSQSSGYYIWDAYKMFGSQWNSMQNVFLREGYFNHMKLNSLSGSLIDSLLSSLAALCLGNLRNDYMNGIDRSIQERFIQIKDILEDDRCISMTEYYDRTDFLTKMLNILYQLFREAGYSAEQFCQLEVNWLWKLVSVIFKFGKDGIYWSNTMDMDAFKVFMDAVLDKENKSFFGIELFEKAVLKMENCLDKENKEKIDVLFSKYQTYSADRINVLWAYYVGKNKLQEECKSDFFNYSNITMEKIMQLAFEKEDRGDCIGAVRIIEQAMEEFPQHYESFLYELSLLYFRNREYSSAITGLTETYQLTKNEEVLQFIFGAYVEPNLELYKKNYEYNKMEINRKFPEFSELQEHPVSIDSEYVIYFENGNFETEEINKCKNLKIVMQIRKMDNFS